MSDRLLTVDSCGDAGTVSMNDLFCNNYDFQFQLMEYLKREAATPNSEFIQILRQAMNTIADEEVIKVLK